MTKSHVGFVVVKVLSVEDTDTQGRPFTISELEYFAKQSGGSMWVLGEDLLTNVALEDTNKIRLDD